MHVPELMVRVLEIRHHLIANCGATTSINARVTPGFPAVPIIGLTGIGPVPVDVVETLEIVVTVVNHREIRLKPCVPASCALYGQSKPIYKG